MNKTEALQMKGIAILMMLFLHLFNTTARVELCDTFINFWNGKPLVLAMSRIAGFCVPIYLFISGYGLTESSKKRGVDNMHPLKRIFKLYVNFWIVFIIFIPLGHFLKPEIYTTDFPTLLTNFLAVRYEYNHEWWFLFPYFMLVLGFRPLICLVSRFTPRQNLCLVLLMFILQLSVHPILKIVGSFYGSHLIDGYFSTLTSFTLGMMFSHYKLFPVCAEYISSHLSVKKRLILILLLISLLVLRMMLGPSVINPLFIIPFFILTLNIIHVCCNTWINSLLLFLAGIR